MMIEFISRHFPTILLLNIFICGLNFTLGIINGDFNSGWFTAVMAWTVAWLENKQR